MSFPLVDLSFAGCARIHAIGIVVVTETHVPGIATANCHQVHMERKYAIGIVAEQRYRNCFVRQCADLWGSMKQEKYFSIITLTVCLSLGQVGKVEISGSDSFNISSSGIWYSNHCFNRL